MTNGKSREEQWRMENQEEQWRMVNPDIEKKNILKKCNFLIIIFFSQIAQATTLEKFNVTCFPRGWHNKNISVCSNITQVTKYFKRCDLNKYRKMIRGKQVAKYFKRCGLKKIRENNTRKTSNVSTNI
jgi:hypothetical protein